MQPPLWQFWTDFIFKVLGTVATFLAVVVALFGAGLRSWLWPPGLTISLANTEGHPSTVFAFEKSTGRQLAQTDGFWWFVRVENKTRWNPVTDVFIILLSVEAEDAARNFTTIWFGRAALGWRLDASAQAKKIGDSAECDLCRILKQPLAVHLSPIIHGQVPEYFAEKFRIRLTLQARGVEADSNILRVEISWDGKWADNKEDMKRQLVVRTV